MQRARALEHRDETVASYLLSLLADGSNGLRWNRVRTLPMFDSIVVCFIAHQDPSVPSRDNDLPGQPSDFFHGIINPQQNWNNYEKVQRQPSTVATNGQRSPPRYGAGGFAILLGYQDPRTLMIAPCPTVTPSPTVTSPAPRIASSCTLLPPPMDTDPASPTKKINRGSGDQIHQREIFRGRRLGRARVALHRPGKLNF